MYLLWFLHMGFLLLLHDWLYASDGTITDDDDDDGMIAH